LIKKKKHETVLYTVFHPYSISFLKNFIEDLEKQYFKNFDVYLCFNNLKNKNIYLNEVKKINKKTSFNIHYTFQDKDPITVRKQNLKFLTLKYKKIVLLDSDDKMGYDRMQIVHQKLNTHSFVVNNIKNLKTNKTLFSKKNINVIKLSSILDNSFVGLSNLAIKSNALKNIINKIEKKLLVLDWQIATLLLLFKQKGFYIGNIFTYYRIYENNYIGRLNNNENLDRKLKIKLLHYKYFSKYNKVFKKKFEDLNKNKKRKKINTIKNKFYDT